MAFPTTLDDFTNVVDDDDDVMANDINELQEAIEALEAKVGIDSSAVVTSLDYLVNNFFTSGRKLWLYEDTAPTGWSTVAVTDKVLAVKGGSSSYNISGGNTGGDFNHTHPVIIPRTGWGYNTSFNWVAGDNLVGAGSGSAGNYSDQTLDRTLTSGNPTTNRPAAAVGIIVQKT